MTTDRSTNPDDEQTEGPDGRARRRRRPRRAERAATNPRTDDAPDLAVPREPPAAAETQHERWLREQRPPHWE